MLQILAFLLIGLVPPLGLGMAGTASWTWICLGATAWGAAVVMKVILAGPVSAFFERLTTNKFRQCLGWGLWSAACELGIAAVIFLAAGPFPRIGNALGFGISAGCAEVLFTLALGLASAGKEETQPSAGPDETFVSWSGVIERLLATAGHIASRGLVWTGLQSWPLAPGLALAFATFALVDGVATYGVDSKWDWTDPGTARRFYGFVAAITVLEVVAFIGSLQYLGLLTTSSG